MRLMRGLLITFIAVIVVLISNPFDIRDIMVEKIQTHESSAKEQ